MEKQCMPPPKELTTPDAVPDPKRTSLAGHRPGDLRLGKTDVLWDLGDIPCVSLECFKLAALPPLCEQIDIAKIKDSLQTNPEGWIQDTERWAAFKNEPSVSCISQEKDFEPLSNIFNAVVREASKATNTPAKLTFASRPAASPISERFNAILPDAYLLLVDKKSIDAQVNKEDHAQNSNPDSWDDIVVSFELKKGNGDAERKDNDKQVVWSLYHIMRSDPCRRATFGVTIENTKLRFWFTCRAVTLVSKTFDFFSEPEHLIYFFCSLAFASDHELGWDPTIRRVCVGDKTQYDITVTTDEGKVLVYETTRVISNFGADALIGRGTRIFEVYLKSHDGKPVKDAEPAVLKDWWRDSDRDREDRILEQIFADLRNHKGIEQADEARKYFLTVLAAGNVMVDGKIDGTDSLLRMFNLPTDCTWYPLPADELQQPIPTRTGVGRVPSFPWVVISAKRSQVDHRTHCRLVFKEVGYPIYEFRRLDTMFETLQDAHKALQLLHSVGWVHRDVSPGNILRVGKLGKLADLEYAKRLDSHVHEVRTGTLGFMACEVVAQDYLFHALASVIFNDDDQSNEDIEINERLEVNKDPEIPFKFNPLHDMESIWWIQVWILYYHVDRQGGQPSSEQTKCFHKLFPAWLDPRIEALLGYMKIHALPTSFQRVAPSVASMHVELRKAYFVSEKSLPPAYTDALADLHSVFTEHLALAVNLSRGVLLFGPSAKCSQHEDASGETRDRKLPKLA
ncbi:hypothetical protein EDC04DRAFT_1249500 [Pisolithus marmoratus]|nr:hypothetical protein EDC04DRAFT_1249500 [Pisolithus marmoratus]